MSHQEMNLNIRYDLPQEIWESIIPQIYQATRGWIGFSTDEQGENFGLPHWFSFDTTQKYIAASVEPSGLHFLVIWAMMTGKLGKKK